MIRDKIHTEKEISSIYDQYFTQLMLFGFKFTNNRQDVEDVVSGVFYKILRKNIKLPEQSKIKSYLYQSVYRDIINLKKRQNMESSYAQEEYDTLNFSALSSSLEQMIDLNEWKEELYSKINKLPTACKKVVMLSLKEYGRKQIAKELGITEETVKAHKRNAIRKLRDMSFLIFSVFFIIILPHVYFSIVLYTNNN